MEIETDFLRRRTLREPAETGKICLGEPGSFKEENPCSPKSPWNPKFSHLPLLMGYLLVPSTRHTWKGVSRPPCAASRLLPKLPVWEGSSHRSQAFLTCSTGSSAITWVLAGASGSSADISQKHALWTEGLVRVQPASCFPPWGRPGSYLPSGLRHPRPQFPRTLPLDQ